jgi:eukaryotic-like serine/threonine-protein kinase
MQSDTGKRALITTPGARNFAGYRLEPGQALGSFEIVAPIGSGGMGEVYRARDTRLRREVALKVLPQEFVNDAGALARFEREARAVAALSHPNIRGIYDLGRHQELVFAVMELLDGETLRHRLRHGPLGVRPAVEIAVQLAQGLGAAHEKGIVHRDIKPENVFITRDGQVKLLDFGLAREAPGRRAAESADGIGIDLTGPGMMVGTPRYMSPEQVSGEEADPRSDLFGLGSLLYEMLAGTPPFEGASVHQVLVALLRDDPRDLQSANPKVPAGLARIVHRCLAKRPEQRFQSARDLAFALGESVAGAGPATTGPSPRRGRYALFGLAAGLALGAALGVLLPVWRRPPPPDPPGLRYLSYTGRDTSPSASPDGRTIAFTSHRDGRSRIWLRQLQTGDEAALTAGPDAFPRFSPDGSQVLFSRKEEARISLYAVGALGGEPRRLVADALEGDWSPDGKRVAFVRGVAASSRFVLKEASLEGGGERELARIENRFPASPRYSPDGRFLAVYELLNQYVAGSPTSLRIYDLRAGTSRGLTVPRTVVGALGASLAWNGGGEEVLLAASPSVGLRTGARLLAQPAAGGPARTLLSTAEPVVGLDVLAPGRLVLHATASSQNLYEVPAGGPGAGRWLTRGDSTDRQPAYAPDGEWVIFSSDRMGGMDLWAVSRTSGAFRRLTHDEADDWDPVTDRQGRSLAWSSRRTGHFEIWRAAADGSSPVQVTRDGVDAENPSFSPDGQWIVYSSGNSARTGIWKVRPDGTGARRLTDAFGVIPEVSPDGRYVLYIEQAAQGTQRRLRTVRLEDGARVPFEILLELRERTPGYSMGRARWSPDGRAIAFVGQDAAGRHGVFMQEFDPGRDTAATRRPLAGFAPGDIVESFGFSGDGRWLTLAVRQQNSSLLLADGVEGVAPARQPEP